MYTIPKVFNMNNLSLRLWALKPLSRQRPRLYELNSRKYSSLSFRQRKKMYRTSYRNSNRISNRSHPKKWLFHGASRRLQTGMIGKLSTRKEHLFTYGVPSFITKKLRSEVSPTDTNSSVMATKLNSLI